jgi:hypothetical protein
VIDAPEWYARMVPDRAPLDAAQCAEIDRMIRDRRALLQAQAQNARTHSGKWARHAADDAEQACRAAIKADKWHRDFSKE